jgi:hypothetical protein
LRFLLIVGILDEHEQYESNDNPMNNFIKYLNASNPEIKLSNHEIKCKIQIKYAVITNVLNEIIHYNTND